eukprot:2840738-Prymnesium_polylepis.2
MVGRLRLRLPCRRRRELVVSGVAAAALLLGAAEVLPPRPEHVGLLHSREVGRAGGVDMPHGHELVDPVAVLLHAEARVDLDALGVEPPAERLNERVGRVDHAQRRRQPHPPRVCHSPYARTA